MKPFDQLPRSNPFKEDVDPQSILDFLDAAQQAGTELHSVMVVRNGKVVYEGWWEPFAPNTLQACYSATKSFTSAAVGFAVQEKILSVTDRLAEIFPDKLPKNPSKYLLSMSIRDLLCMSGGQPREANVKGQADWAKAFLSVEVTDKPGTVFKYNSIGSHMLAEILFRLTGDTLTEYLTPRLFRPLGIERFRWDRTPSGIEIGGWGLHLPTESLAKMGLLLLQHGKWDGMQVLPEQWVREASRKQIENDKMNEWTDFKAGYGYQLWKCTPAESFRLDGAFGQFAVVLPRQNAVIAITEYTGNPQLTLDLLWKHVLTGMENGAQPGHQAEAMLAQRTSNLVVPAATAGHSENTELSGHISGAAYVFEKNSESLDVEFERELSMPEPDGIHTLRLDFAGQVCGVTFSKGGHDHVIRIGLDHQYRVSVFKLGTHIQPVMAMGGWVDESCFEFIMRPVESPQSNIVKLIFSGQSICMQWHDIYSGDDKPHRLMGMQS